MRYLGFVTALVFSMQAFAWGEFGHETIGEIAQRQMCAQAKQTALALLSGETMAQASTWADDVRNDDRYDYIKPWHYVQMPLGSRYQDAKPYPKGDVVQAIVAQTARLKNSGLSNAERAEALRMVIHFVGDAHQPLHAGEGEDRGGNSVHVVWFGYDTNLHHVWDSEMFRHMGRQSYSAFADSLLAEHKETFDQLTAVDWVNESSAIAKGVYPAAGSIQLGNDYNNKFLPVAKERVWLAGVRLAAVLNQTLGCN